MNGRGGLFLRIPLTPLKGGKTETLFIARAPPASLPSHCEADSPRQSFRPPRWLSRAIARIEAHIPRHQLPRLRYRESTPAFMKGNYSPLAKEACRAKRGAELPPLTRGGRGVPTITFPSSRGVPRRGGVFNIKALPSQGELVETFVIKPLDIHLIFDI